MPPAPDDASSRAPRTAVQRAIGNEIGRYAGLGLSYALTIGLFALGGWWLDGRLGTLPLFLLVGVLLGFVGSTVSLVRKATPRETPKNRPFDAPKQNP